MVVRALSFGAVAAEYERFRPGYPPELVDRVVAYAGRPVRTALEIGAGTGKATRAFAGRGIAVTATDPDESMLRELRPHVPPGVVTVRGALEDLTGAGTYDLVFAAAALHWTDPVGRWARVAELLEPGGVFASFAGQVRPADPVVEEAERAARSPFLADDGVPYPGDEGAGSRMLWPGPELEQEEAFADVQQVLVERRFTLSAGDWVGYLSTVSAYLELERSQRQAALGAVRRALPAQVDVDADIVLHLARRR